MSARNNRSFRPTVDTLENRLVPSANLSAIRPDAPVAVHLAAAVPPRNTVDHHDHITKSSHAADASLKTAASVIHWPKRLTGTVTVELDGVDTTPDMTGRFHMQIDFILFLDRTSTPGTSFATYSLAHISGLGSHYRVSVGYWTMDTVPGGRLGPTHFLNLMSGQAKLSAANHLWLSSAFKSFNEANLATTAQGITVKETETDGNTYDATWRTGVDEQFKVSFGQNVKTHRLVVKINDQFPYVTPEDVFATSNATPSSLTIDAFGTLTGKY